jgi:hypothetical protein
MSDCILHSGFIAPNGYRLRWVPRLKKSMLAHRVAWEQAFGAIPPGTCILHKCDNRACINPEHLFLGTRKDNAEDCVRKGRTNHGSARPQAKLTEDQVVEIRRAYSAKEATQYQLASTYGVHQAMIWRIIHKLRWRYA